MDKRIIAVLWPGSDRSKKLGWCDGKKGTRTKIATGSRRWRRATTAIQSDNIKIDTGTRYADPSSSRTQTPSHMKPLGSSNFDSNTEPVTTPHYVDSRSWKPPTLQRTLQHNLQNLRPFQQPSQIKIYHIAAQIALLQSHASGILANSHTTEQMHKRPSDNG